MNNYVTIQEAVPRLESEFDWHHSYIREWYFTTLSCSEELRNDEGDNIICTAWAPQDLRLVVATAGSATVFGIEFLCFGVEAFSMQGSHELTFRCEASRHGTPLDFADMDTDSRDCWLVAKEVRVAFLGREYLGPFLRLGHELPRDDAINAAKIDECWRQCTDCSNAWMEGSDIRYSRCPECGQLTRLLGSE